MIAAASELRLDFIQEFMKFGIDLNQRIDEGIYGYLIWVALARESLGHKLEERGSLSLLKSFWNLASEKFDGQSIK